MLRLSALVTLQIHSLKRIFHPGHRDSLLYVQFLRARSLSIFVLHTNYQGVGPTCHNFFLFYPPLPRPLSLSPSLPPLSLRPAPAGLSPSAAPPRGAPWPEQAGAADARAQGGRTGEGPRAPARQARRRRRAGGAPAAWPWRRARAAWRGGAEKDERARERQFPESSVPRHGCRAGARSPFWRAA